MNKPLSPKPVQAASFERMQQLMSTSPVPSISTELLVTADGELNRELNSFLFDPPSNPELLKGKRILVGPKGGGTHALALRLLAANGITAETATLINHELPDYVDILGKGEADAAVEARRVIDSERGALRAQQLFF